MTFALWFNGEPHNTQTQIIMDGTKTYIFGNDGNDRGINPALLALLNQNGGFGNGAAWLMPMFLYMMFPWLFGGMNGGFGGFGGFGGITDKFAIR